MTSDTVAQTSALGIHHPSFDPVVNLNEWRIEQESTLPLNEAPADILSEREQAANRRAALEAFMAVDRITGHKYDKGIRYLFAIHVHNQDPEEIARLEKTTPEKVKKAVHDACLALRPVLAPFVQKP